MFLQNLEVFLCKKMLVVLSMLFHSQDPRRIKETVVTCTRQPIFEDISAAASKLLSISWQLSSNVLWMQKHEFFLEVLVESFVSVESSEEMQGFMLKINENQL